MRRDTAGRLAWIVALITFGALMVSGGVRVIPGVLIQPLDAEFGWGKAGISMAAGVNFVMFGLGGPFVGALIDRLGPRKVMITGLGLLVAGLAPLLLLRSLWHLVALWGVVTALGTGALGSVLGAAVAYRWFPDRRGLFVGLFGTASSIGQLLFLPAVMGLTSYSGWRSAVGMVALVAGLLLIPVLILLKQGSSPADQQAAPAVAGGQVLAAAMRSRDFWLIAASFFICGYTSDGLVGTHFLTHASEHGFSEVGATSAMTVVSLTNILGTVIAGALSDGVDNRKLLAVFYGLRALSLAWLPFVDNMPGLLLFAAVNGLDWSATVPPTVNLLANRFGRDSIGTLYGWVFFVHMVGAGVASYAGGLLRDGLGDYGIAFISAAGLGLAAAGLTMTVRSGPRAPGPAQNPAAS